MDDRSQRIQIERRILSYLLRHPDARDALAGIRRWWLGDREEWSGRDVEEAIEELIERRWMTETELQTGVNLYGMNADAREELERRAAELEAGTWPM